MSKIGIYLKLRICGGYIYYICIVLPLKLYFSQQSVNLRLFLLTPDFISCFFAKLIVVHQPQAIEKSVQETGLSNRSHKIIRVLSFIGMTIPRTIVIVCIFWLL